MKIVVPIFVKEFFKAGAASVDLLLSLSYPIRERF